MFRLEKAVHRQKCLHWLVGSRAARHSSQHWIARQLADPYVVKAKHNSYRCRSAFKLKEINEKCKILRPGDVIVDCGASPGSWVQIAVTESNSNGSKLNMPMGKVIGVDINHIHHSGMAISYYFSSHFSTSLGAVLLGGMDFREQKTKGSIEALLEGRMVNCFISDMAPKATGIKSLDQEVIIELILSVLRCAVSLSAENGHLLMKALDNSSVSLIEKFIRKYYRVVKRVKPSSSRMH